MALNTITRRMAHQLQSAFTKILIQGDRSALMWTNQQINGSSLMLMLSVKGPMDRAAIGGVLQDSKGKWI